MQAFGSLELLTKIPLIIYVGIGRDLINFGINFQFVFDIIKFIIKYIV